MVVNYRVSALRLFCRQIFQNRNRELGRTLTFSKRSSLSRELVGVLHHSKLERYRFEDIASTRQTPFSLYTTRSISHHLFETLGRYSR
jgi:hypothetical protein